MSDLISFPCFTGAVPIDDNAIYLMPGEVELLASVIGEYSCSLPTGTRVGKFWLCDRNAYRRDLGPNREPDWWLGQYVEDSVPGFVGIRWRKVVHDEKRMAQDAAERLRGER